METVFERNGNDVIIGDATVKIEDNTVSAVSIFAKNPIYDETIYCKDGWIRDMRTGKQLSKFFMPIWNTKSVIWEPKLDNIAKIEQSRWNVLQHYNKKRDKLYNPVIEALKKSRWACVKHPDERNAYFHIKIVESCYGPLLDIHVLRKDDKVPQQRNKQLALNYIYVNNILNFWKKQCYKFNSALLQSVAKKYSTSMYERHDSKIMKLTINGREYWFEASRGFAYFCLPEDIICAEEN